MMVLQIVEELRSQGSRVTYIVLGRRGKTSDRVHCWIPVQKVVDHFVRMKNVRYDAKACVHPLSTSNVLLEADSLHILDMFIACVHARVIDPIDSPLVIDQRISFRFIRVRSLSLKRKERMRVALLGFLPSRWSLCIAWILGWSIVVFFFFCASGGSSALVSYA